MSTEEELKGAPLENECMMPTSIYLKSSDEEFGEEAGGRSPDTYDSTSGAKQIEERY